MLLFGHLGLGVQLARPFIPKKKKNYQVKWLLLGTLFPDILDKVLYYGLAFATGQHGAELGLISGTRTFGHTLLLPGIFLLYPRTRVFGIAMLSHLVLDLFGDWIHLGQVSFETIQGMLFPIFGAQFPSFPFENASGHFWSKFSTFYLMSEGLGLLGLYWFFRARGLLGRGR